MLLAPILVSILGQLPSDDFARQSRKYLEPLGDWKLDKDRLVFKVNPGALDVSALLENAYSVFPNMGRVRVSSSSSSTSSSRGGDGSVSVQIGGGDGSSNTISVAIARSGGTGTVNLKVQGGGELELQVTRAGTSVKYEQEKDKCRLEVKAGAGSFTIVRPTMIALVEADPIRVRKYLFGCLDLYFDKPPFVAFWGLQGDKTVFTLRDGAEIRGEPELTEISLETRYGKLSIPRSEVLQIFFPGSEFVPDPASPSSAGQDGKNAETVVVTRKFVPRGRLSLEKIKVKTSYGELTVEASEIVHVTFGSPPAPEKR